MAAKDGDVVWFFEQFNKTLKGLSGVTPVKGSVVRVVPNAVTGLTTVDVVVKDASLPAWRNSRVIANVAYVPAAGYAPATGYYCVADNAGAPAAYNTGSAAHPAPATPNPIKPLPQTGLHLSRDYGTHDSVEDSDAFVQDPLDMSLSTSLSSSLSSSISTSASTAKSLSTSLSSGTSGSTSTSTSGSLSTSTSSSTSSSLSTSTSTGQGG